MLTYGRVSETGLNANYFEDYTLIDDGGGRFLALDCPEHSRLLVVVGNHFLFARGRALDLPRGATLADLVAQADPAERRALLECEFPGARAWRATIPGGSIYRPCSSAKASDLSIRRLRIPFATSADVPAATSTWMRA